MLPHNEKNVLYPENLIEDIITHVKKYKRNNNITIDTSNLTEDQIKGLNHALYELTGTQTYIIDLLYRQKKPISDIIDMTGFTYTKIRNLKQQSIAKLSSDPLLNYIVHGYNTMLNTQILKKKTHLTEYCNLVSEKLDISVETAKEKLMMPVEKSGMDHRLCQVSKRNNYNTIYDIIFTAQNEPKAFETASGFGKKTTERIQDFLYDYVGIDIAIKP